MVFPNHLKPRQRSWTSQIFFWCSKTTLMFISSSNRASVLLSFPMMILYRLKYRYLKSLEVRYPHVTILNIRYFLHFVQLLKSSQDFWCCNSRHVFFSPGKTKGLLGVWDDDVKNDFTLPNGEKVDVDSNSSTIHWTFGQKCTIQLLLYFNAFVYLSDYKKKHLRVDILCVGGNWIVYLRVLKFI